jgi:hypothetical protein
MMVPWVELEEHRDGEVPTSRVYPESAWHAMFACLVQIPPYQEWARLKWGLNASWLFDEAMERQKLFLESQYGYPDEFGIEHRDYRTLAFRFINRPGVGLAVMIVGKIHARTREQARENAISYYSEIKSTLPYDYGLVPACSEHEFYRWSGNDIIDDHRSALAEIKRMEFPITQKNKSLHLQGFWRSGLHAHEQIWRSLAGSSSPLLLNISLRSTILYESERAAYLQSVDEISAVSDQPLNRVTINALKQWNQNTVERRLAPWKKFFYLQVHLISTQKLSPDLFRTVGTTLALDNKGESLPGYQVILPRPDEIQAWRRKIKSLDIILSESSLPCPRLSEVADLEEVFEVIRLPYSPPDEGLPNLHFMSDKGGTENNGSETF